ncbi:hypothetical protein BGW80DRAFT_1460008 [Lactifluus volemus]|nr:hypothetical protein BGW80DRAFT_1460008 [Lactifluus volemus]
MALTTTTMIVFPYATFDTAGKLISDPYEVPDVLTVASIPGPNLSAKATGNDEVHITATKSHPVANLVSSNIVMRTFVSLLLIPIFFISVQQSPSIRSRRRLKVPRYCVLIAGSPPFRWKLHPVTSCTTRRREQPSSTGSPQTPRTDLRDTGMELTLLTGRAVALSPWEIPSGNTLPIIQYFEFLAMYFSLSSSPNSRRA